MREAGERICAAAAALVGTPFRLHGRLAETGVDCVGLALLSLRAAGLNVPEPPPYRLRAGGAPGLLTYMAAAGFRAGAGRRAGDLVLVRVSAVQPHLLVDALDGMIHAHAGLGRVVRGPVPVDWREIGRWRVTLTGD